MDASHAIKMLEEWDLIIRRQGKRLYILQEYINGQNYLAIINPELQEKIDNIVGYKINRTVTVHEIGATLFFINMFPIEKEEEEKAKYVLLMLGAKNDGSLDIERANFEINELRHSLN